MHYKKQKGRNKTASPSTSNRFYFWDPLLYSPSVRVPHERHARRRGSLAHSFVHPRNDHRSALSEQLTLKMFGSGARNISFQDLFARPQQDAPATAPDTAMRRERRASPRRHVLPTSAPNEHVGCVARGDAAIGGRQLLPLRIGQKSSIDFILTGLPQDRVDTKLPPQRQIAQVKREPAHFEGGATAHNVSYHRSHHLSHHESDESSDSYEGLPVPREALRLPSIVPNIFINQQHAFQQHQASTAVESPAEETSSGKRKKKRKARICKEEGCDKYVVDHGLCIRHGVRSPNVKTMCFR